MFSYQKLGKNQAHLEEIEQQQQHPQEEREEEQVSNIPTLRSTRGWLNLRKPSYSYSTNRRWWRRRPRVRILGLRRLVGRKTRVVRAAVRKVMRRFKEGRSHFGDLFAGNYMFIQVNPTPPPPVSYLEKSFMNGYGGGGGGHSLPAPSSRYYLPWVA